MPFLGTALGLAALLPLTSAPPAQQVIDPAFHPAVDTPAYAAGAGPRVLIDRGHHTFHAEDEHFAQLASLLRRDGYRAAGLREPFAAAVLAQADVLVIVNAAATAGEQGLVLPTAPAFTTAEVAAVRTWVHGGGSLLLVVDHMPFPGAAAALGREFGVELMNGFAIVEADWDPLVFRRADATLRAHPITDGRHAAERVDEAVTFVAGHAFRATDDRVRPLLVFGPGVVSINPSRAWVFDADTPRVPVEGWLQGAAAEPGAGRVAIFGEAAMFAAQLTGPKRRQVGMNSPSGRGNLQLLLNAMHWLSRAPGFDRTGRHLADVSLFTAPLPLGSK